MNIDPVKWKIAVAKSAKIKNIDDICCDPLIMYIYLFCAKTSTFMYRIPERITTGQEGAESEEELQNQ